VHEKQTGYNSLHKAGNNKINNRKQKNKLQQQEKTQAASKLQSQAATKKLLSI
jgi:hypothetical protein